MSYVSLVEQSTTPATPPAGKTRIYINTGGTISSVDDAGVVTTYGSGITPEQVQDIVGAMMIDTATIDVTYDDPAGTISFDVITGGVNHNALLNYVANQHVDHSTVSISAGTGLTGGGDITANRTISMPNTGTAGTYRSVTTDAQGRVTAGTNPTTLAGYGITDAQPLDADLTAIAGLAGSGLVTRTGAGTATTRTLSAGTYITVSNGDGVSGNPTVTHANSAAVAGTYGSATQVPQVAVGATGHVDSVSNVAIAISSTAVTDFAEAAQDAVGGALVDSSSVDFTYSDAGNTITAAVIPAGVNHNSLLNGGGTIHTDHATVSINAGTYLSGGGDITATRTINHANSAVTPATYGGVNAIPVLGIGATGHVDSASTVNPTAALLTGLGAGSNTSILSTDTLLAAVAKLQAQVDALVAADNTWTELETTADIIVNSAVTLTNVTELGFSAVAGRSYYMEYTVIFRTAATTTGIALSLGTSNTAAGTISAQVNIPIAADGTAALYTGSITAFGDTVVATGVQTAQPTWFIATIRASFSCATSGTVVPQFRSEVALSNVNFGTGSYALIREFA